MRRFSRNGLSAAVLLALISAGWGLKSGQLGLSPPSPECSEALRGARKILDQQDSNITESERIFLRERYARTLREDAACGEFAFQQLEKAPGHCGLGLDLVANELFYAPDPAVRRARLGRIAVVLRSGREECRARVALNTAFLNITSKQLALSVLEVVRSSAPSSDAQRMAWLAYGSLAEIAYSSGDQTLSRDLEVPILQALASTQGVEERSFQLSVAGNAGCQSCYSEIRKSLKDSHPDLRMTATHSLRFLEAAESVGHLCDALLGDAQSAVRDIAAWSLQWRRTEPEARAECLVAAAASDPSLQVRKQAVLALNKLSEDLEIARDGLLHLTLPEYPEPVRRLAMGGLRSSAAARVTDGGRAEEFSGRY
jgi:hypothetical protein